MQPTTVTNKNIANGVPKKRAGKSDNDSSAPDSPLELQNLCRRCAQCVPATFPCG